MNHGRVVVVMAVAVMLTLISTAAFATDAGSALVD